MRSECVKRTVRKDLVPNRTRSGDWNEEWDVSEEEGGPFSLSLLDPGGENVVRHWQWETWR